MSLFACEKCGVVENTALSSKSRGIYVLDGKFGMNNPRLCSLCGDGKWHGLWPRHTVEEGGYVQGKFGLERKK